MTPTGGFILCLAYIVGLLATAIPGGGYGVLLLGIVAAAIAHQRFRLPRAIAQRLNWLQHWPTDLKPPLLIAAGIVGLLASFYLQIRTPQPTANDISTLVVDSPASQEQIVTVQGRVASLPHLTRSQRAQFWLQANQMYQVVSPDQTAETSRPVSGKVYVTVPLLQATGLQPSQLVAVTGSLYKPQAAQNPGGFDFQKYLAQEGSFAGLSARQVVIPSTSDLPTWGWWAIRQRIVQAQVRWLGSPEGPLVSAMVLGGRAVDLPYDIKDQFAKIGLAHALAASGFQTSLILGVVLAATRRFAARLQLIAGASALGLFLGLAGFQPAVLRATLMGLGALVALVLQRRAKPIASLLIAATVLLLLNPLWIWNLGFQLSILATLGLLVTVAPVVKRLDWLPPTIATALAVPIAAYLWTLPLQLYGFGLVSPYSILVNLITTPLIALISLGGVISAVAAMLWPLAGSALAWLLYYPTHALIAIVSFFSQLPGNAIAIGTISVLQVVALYGLISLVWLQTWWRRYWWLAGLLAAMAIAIPLWSNYTTLFQVTVLATKGEPVLVVQDQGRVGLVNSGDETSASFTVLPFLQKRGANQIDWAVAPQTSHNSNRGWVQILNSLPVQTFYREVIPNSNDQELRAVTSPVDTSLLNDIPSEQSQILAVNQKVQVGSSTLQLLNTSPTVWKFRLQNQDWLWLNHLKSREQNTLAGSGRLSPTPILWWTGEPLAGNLLQVVKPRVAIASATSIDPDTLTQLKQRKIQVYWTGRDGAVQWTPSRGFTVTQQSGENEASLF